MRLLVACPACRQQYRARPDKIGTRFRCRCGQIVSVTQPRGHDSRVVRCSSCGAARRGPGRSCEHCGSDFTLYERDLFTVCPHCLTNVSDRARYCHSCGGLITAEESIESTSDRCCPACLDRPSLHGRRLGVSRHPALECDACAGLWLGREVFEHLVKKANEKSLAPLFAPCDRSDLVQPDLPPRRSGYLPCPVCGAFMHRRNYGLRLSGGGSGIIIDSCKPHGTWFDPNELTRILDWLRKGGSQSSLLEQKKAHLREQRRRETASSRESFLTGDTADSTAFAIFDVLFTGGSHSSSIVDTLVESFFGFR